MIDIKDFGLFITLSWILIITPGPDLLYVLARGMSNGKKAGLISAAGVTSGIFVHTLLAAVGLSLLLKTSAIAFMIVKIFGAGYLIYMGIKSIIEKNISNIERIGKLNNKKVFIQGFISNTFNPKIALFFIAFLPQFVNVKSQQSIPIQLVLLGLIFATFGFIFLSALGYFSGKIGQYLIAKNSLFAKRLQIISGYILIALGIRLAFTKLE